MPSINALDAGQDGDGLRVLLVDIKELPETVAQAVSTRGYTARVLLDVEGRATDAYQVRATPTVYLIGRDGMLVGKAVGPRPWTQESGRALLAALLKTGSASRR